MTIDAAGTLTAGVVATGTSKVAEKNVDGSTIKVIDGGIWQDS